MLLPMEIRGEKGISLNDHWDATSQGVAQAYFETCVSGFPNFFVMMGVSLSTYSENNLTTQSHSLSETPLRATFRSYTPWSVRSTSRYSSLLPFCEPFPRIIHVQSPRPWLFSAPPPASLKSSPKLHAPMAHGYSARPKISSGLPAA